MYFELQVYNLPRNLIGRCLRVTWFL